MDALDRTLQPTRRVLGDVDPAQPLDPTSSLTDGLQGFWMPLPRTTGGSRLYDLSAYGRHAVLNKPDFFSWSSDSSRPSPLLSYEPEPGDNAKNSDSIAFHQVSASQAWKSPFTILLHVYYREWGGLKQKMSGTAPLVPLPITMEIINLASRQILIPVIFLVPKPLRVC